MRRGNFISSFLPKSVIPVRWYSFLLVNREEYWYDARVWVASDSCCPVGQWRLSLELKVMQYKYWKWNKLYAHTNLRDACRCRHTLALQGECMRKVKVQVPSCTVGHVWLKAACARAYSVRWATSFLSLLPDTLLTTVCFFPIGVRRAALPITLVSCALLSVCSFPAGVTRTATAL